MSLQQPLALTSNDYLQAVLSVLMGFLKGLGITVLPQGILFVQSFYEAGRHLTRGLIPLENTALLAVSDSDHWFS